MSEKNYNEDVMAEAIVKKESENAAAFLAQELKKELAAANSHNMTPIRVVVIGGNEQYYRSVLTQLRTQYPDVEFVKFISTGGNNAFFAIDSLNPDILLVAHDAPIQNAIQFYDAIQTQTDAHGVRYAEKYQDKRIIVISPNDYQYAVEIRNHGVQYMLPVVDPRFHSVDTTILMKVIREAYNDIQQRKYERETGFQVVSHDSPMVGMNGFVPPRQQLNATPQQNYGYGMQEEQPMTPHKIIGIYSGTGGAGTTTFAANLASILAKYTMEGGSDYRVCLVEYNLACRNIDIFFNIKFPPQSKKSITSIAQDAHAMYFNKNEDAIVAGPREMIPLISRYTEHIPSIGLDIIPGISVPLEIDNISTGFSTALFTSLRQVYDVVIVDLSADVAKMAMLETMNEIDDFYYIMPMDVPSIRNARVLIRFLAGYFKKAPEEIKVIMNKVDPENEIFGIDQVTNILLKKGEENCTPEGTIPYAEKDVTESINVGTPIALLHPEHPVSQAIFSIALGINPMLNMGILEQEQEETEKKPGLFSKILGGGKKPEAKSKKGVFKNKKNDVKLIAAPSAEAAPKAAVQESASLDSELQEFAEEEEKPKKKGFFSWLFGGSKKKDKKPKKTLTRKR